MKPTTTTDPTLEEQHEAALSLLSPDPFSLFESAQGVEVFTVPGTPSASGPEARFFLCFAVEGGGEVLAVAYACQENGRVLSWNARFEMWAATGEIALAKLRFAIINEVIEQWTL